MKTGQFPHYIHEFVWDMAGNRIFLTCMKALFMLFLVWSQVLAYSQSDSIKKYNYEISFSYDQSVSAPDIPFTQGFGLGFTHVMGKSKMIRYTIGYNFQLTQRPETLLLYSFDSSSQIMNSRVSYSHFSIPMTLRFFIGNKFRVLLEPGICGDLLVFTRVQGEGEEIPFPKIDVFLEYKRFKFCPTLAAGMQYVLGEHIITAKAELKYALNFPNNTSYLEDLNRYWRIVAAFQF